MMGDWPLLTIATLWPFAAAGAVALFGRGSASSARTSALGAAIVQLAVVVAALAQAYGNGWESAERFAIPGSSAAWSLVLDGLAAPFVALTAVLCVLGVIASWRVADSPGAHHALLLALSGAVTGVFLAADVILFYVFWEAVLVPMYFLIGVWGHEDRRHAATKFFLFTFAGSALMLVGLLVAVFTTRQLSFEGLLAAGLPGDRETLVFWLLAIGFLVKIPAWPLHSWLPDAHVEAPTAGSMILAGVLLKMGAYGLIRLGMPMAPEAFADGRPILAALGIVGIVYGALMAFSQSDLKRLVAFSSVSHMGFVTLAVAVGSAASLNAAVLGMVSHGVVAPLLFFLVGGLYERTHTFDMGRLRGLGSIAKGWSATFVFAALASAGLPGLSGFPGEFLTLTETFRSWGWLAAIPALGVVPAAAYNLRAVRRTVHGPPTDEWESIEGLGSLEVLAAGVLTAGILVLGLWPSVVLSVSGPVITAVSIAAGGS